MVSRIIRDTVEAGLIVPYDEEAGRKYMKYLPSWIDKEYRNLIDGYLTVI